jgi:CheY-like chemotaxis protein
MSHDIRTPLNAVTGYTALALKEENIPQNVRGYLEKIDVSGKQLLALINDILEMSRIESGKTELETSPEDLCDVVEEACHIFDLQMSSKSLNYTVDCKGVRNRYVVCDKVHLDRILMNLVSNACKFTPEGGSVSVKVTEVQSAPDACAYEFAVSDTGIGMTPEFTEHIFGAYERENSSIVNNIQGTGLGMAITKSLVELMGGTIAVSSQKDKGSTFTIRLSFPKAREEDVIKPEKTEKRESRDHSGERILVADDNPINIEIASMILTQEGFEVTTAENGQIAVDLIKEADDDFFSAVLMDVHMPVMGGYEATRTLRQLGGRKAELPIVAISANSFESDRKEAFEAGMDAHIAKPFRPDDLIDTLDKLIDEHKKTDS